MRLQMKPTSQRAHVSRLRRSLLRLGEQAARLYPVFLAGDPMLAGSVYELHRKCGRPNCRCAKDEELHVSKVFSRSEGGNKSTHMVPKGSFVELRILTKLGRCTSFQTPQALRR